MNKTEEQRVKSELCSIKNCKELLWATGLVGGGVGEVQKGRALSPPSWSSHLMGKKVTNAPTFHAQYRLWKGLLLRHTYQKREEETIVVAWYNIQSWILEKHSREMVENNFEKEWMRKTTWPRYHLKKNLEACMAKIFIDMAKSWPWRGESNYRDATPEWS